MPSFPALPRPMDFSTGAAESGVIDNPLGSTEAAAPIARLFSAEGFHRIHRCCATRGHKARRHRRQPEQHGHATQSHSVPRLHAEQQAAYQAAMIRPSRPARWPAPLLSAIPPAASPARTPSCAVPQAPCARQSPASAGSPSTQSLHKVPRRRVTGPSPQIRPPATPKIDAAAPPA